MKVVVIGLNPFGGEEINPALEAVKKLPTETAGAEIIKVEVPTIFGTSGEKVAEAIETHQPDMVTCVGQAGDHQTVTIEKVTINLAEARIPDNAGQQSSDVSLVKDGVTAYFTNLPIKTVVKNCYDHQLSAAISCIAGIFVCSDIMYHLLHLISTKYPTIRGGFIHTPLLPEQTIDKPTLASMSLETITDPLFYMIEAAVKTQEDIWLQGGATHQLTGAFARTEALSHFYKKEK